jgi:hypothetical protein
MYGRVVSNEKRPCDRYFVQETGQTVELDN